MNVLVICGSVLIILVVVICSILVVKDYKTELIEINKEKRRLDEDFDRLETIYAVSSDGIKNINNNSISIINELEKLLESNFLNNKKHIEKLIKLLKENSNNIEINNATKPKINKINANIKTEIKNLCEEINSFYNKKIEVSIDDNIPNNLYYDNIKLISALRLIILQTFKYNIDEKIKISISKEDNLSSNILISIKLDNIKLIKNNKIEVLNNLHQYFILEKSEPKIIDTEIDSEVFTIRQNLYCLSSEVDLINSNNTMIINLELEEEKKQRNNLKALIIDGHKGIAQITQKALKDIKVDSDIILNPMKTRKQLINNHYDIIFTSSRMPEMEGTELLRNLQAIDNFNIPVIVLTAEFEQQESLKTLYGFDDCILKPLTKEKAIKLIEELKTKERI